MYKGFNVKNFNFKQKYTMSLNYEIRHLKENKSIQQTFITPIESYLTKGMNFDGESIRKGWFPSETKFDVFISHSRHDKSLAYALAWWLEKYFGLSCFIDSLVWSHYESLKEKLDKFYTNKYRFAYNETFRNRIYQNIDLMLNTSLMEIMDKCECLFFLNTPNSIHPGEMHRYLTDSPWLFSEISIFNHIKKTEPSRHPSKAVAFCESCESSKILNPVDLSKLATLNYKDLNRWMLLKEFNTKEKHSLDILYEHMNR